MVQANFPSLLSEYLQCPPCYCKDCFIKNVTYHLPRYLPQQRRLFLLRQACMPVMMRPRTSSGYDFVLRWPDRTLYEHILCLTWSKPMKWEWLRGFNIVRICTCRLSGHLGPSWKGSMLGNDLGRVTSDWKGNTDWTGSNRVILATSAACLGSQRLHRIPVPLIYSVVAAVNKLHNSAYYCTYSRRLHVYFDNAACLYLI